MNVFDSLQMVDYIFLNINFYQIIFNDFMHKVKNINLFWLIVFHLITNLQYFLFIILKMSDYDKISLNLSPNLLRLCRFSIFPTLRSVWRGCPEMPENARLTPGLPTSIVSILLITHDE